MSSADKQDPGPITASIERLREELDHWMDRAKSQGEKAMNAVGLKMNNRWEPPVDVYETQEEVVVYVDLPGVDPASVEVVLVGNMLTLSGEKRLPIQSEGNVRHFNERLRGVFSRSVPLPVQVNAESVAAEAKNGVMVIRLGKAEDLKPRQIHVKVQEEQQHHYNN